MSEYQTKTVKETVEDIKSSFNTDIQEKVDAYNNAVTTTKNNVNQAREDIKTTVDDFRNLFNSIKQPQKTTQTETSTVEKTETAPQTTQTQAVQETKTEPVQEETPATAE
jgi:hypothetical protein